MRISIHAPLGSPLPDDIQDAINAAVGDGKTHTVNVAFRPVEQVSVRIMTCDFDPVGRMREIIEKIVEAIYLVLQRAYAVIGTTDVEGATCTRLAYVGFAG